MGILQKVNYRIGAAIYNQTVALKRFDWLDSPHFLLRIDDFPSHVRDSKRFLKFYRLFSKYHVPFLIGITPRLAKNPMDADCKEYHELTEMEVNMIHEFVASGSDIALHGLTHQIRGKVRDEWTRRTIEENEGMLNEGLSILRRHSLETEIFMPPFNKFDWNTISAASKLFKCITGGRQSRQYVGFQNSPSFLNGLCYMPSYPPANEKTLAIRKYVVKIKQSNINAYIPLTIHWATENFNDVRGLCKKIAGQTVSWHRFINELSRRGINEK